MAKGRLCEIAECGKPHTAKGLCKNHLYKLHRYGDPLAGKSLTPRGEAMDFILGLVENKRDECVYWPYHKRGRAANYGGVFFRGRTTVASRVACILLNGEPPTDEHQAAHKCGKGREGCVNPYHTRWATPVENMADMVAHGTRRRGEQVSTCKLTPDAVRELRLDMSRGATQVATAEKFGISRRQVRAIMDGKYWTWVE